MKKPKMKKPSDCSGSVVKLAVSNPVITHEQLAAQDFEPAPAFSAFNLKMIEGNEDRLRTICMAARVGMHMLTMAKAEMIEGVKNLDADDVHASSGILKFICDSRELTEQLVRLIEAAETRYAVAMANVYGEDGSRI